MENPRPIEFFKTLNHYSKFEKKLIIYNYTDKFSPLLAPDFFDEYEEFKLNLALKAIELTGDSDNPVIPKLIDEGDFYRLELYFDVTEDSTSIVEQINGTVDFEPQANDIRGIYTAEPEPEPLDLPNSPKVKTIIIKEPYGEVFANNGFQLFEHILNEYVKSKDKRGRKSDLIYFYWEMYNSTPQYIHQKPEAFFTWFDREYSETSGQLKVYDNVKTDQRKKDYSTALEWFKEKI